MIRSFTKTDYPRVIYFNKRLWEIFDELDKVRSIAHNYVFTYKHKPIKCVRRSFRTACREAKIKNLTMHDFRHTFNTNLRKAGVDRSVIMKLTGHKTMAMFLRYNTIDEEDARVAMEKLDLFLAGEDCSHSAPGRVEAKK
jgi:integrase